MSWAQTFALMAPLFCVAGGVRALDGSDDIGKSDYRASSFLAFACGVAAFISWLVSVL